MSDDRAQEEIRLWERLEGDRTVFKTHWQDVANNLQPLRSDYITERTPGQKLMTYVYDSVPMWALESFAAGMHGLLTSPTLQWFSLKCDDDRIQAMPQVSAWFDAVSQAMYSRFNSAKHNFASQSFQVYEDLGGIGQAAMAIMDSQKTGTLFSCRHMKECVIQQNDEDRTDTLIRSWHYDAKQAYQAWGTQAGEGVLKALDKNDTAKRFRFIHSVRPRLNRDPQRGDRLHMPWMSRYVNATDKVTISEGGFQEFPYVAPRFAVKTGETYGRGIGMTALPDIKMLYEMKKTLLKSAQKILDPPLMVPDDGYIFPVKTTPGAMIWYRAGGGVDEIKPLKTEGNLPIGQDMLQALQTQIIRMFYVEWMLMPSSPDDPAAAGKGVTATYVLQQRDEKMRLLSPMLARLQSEFLGPLIDRTFALMWRQSVLARFGEGSRRRRPRFRASGGMPSTCRRSPSRRSQAS